MHIFEGEWTHQLSTYTNFPHRSHPISFFALILILTSLILCILKLIPAHILTSDHANTKGKFKICIHSRSSRFFALEFYWYQQQTIFRCHLTSVCDPSYKQYLISFSLHCQICRTIFSSALLAAAFIDWTISITIGLKSKKKICQHPNLLNLLFRE